jgi:hypothetical protein
VGFRYESSGTPAVYLHCKVIKKVMDMNYICIKGFSGGLELKSSDVCFLTIRTILLFPFSIANPIMGRKFFLRFDILTLWSRGLFIFVFTVHYLTLRMSGSVPPLLHTYPRRGA